MSTARFIHRCMAAGVDAETAVLMAEAFETEVALAVAELADAEAERKRKQNERKRRSRDGHGTSRDVTGQVVTAPETKVSPPPPHPLSASKTQPPIRPLKGAHSPGKTRESRLCPADWSPGESVGRVGEEMGLTPAEIATQLAMMRDHQFRDAHRDWDAVARNWLRRARPNGSTGPPMSPSDVQRIALKMLQEEEARAEPDS